MAPRTGRRPGKQTTREAILVAARNAFAERGYDRASIRQIAASAGVDPALIHHYFGTKEKLFLEIVQPPIDPGTILPHVFAGGVEGLGERVVRTFLAAWEDPVTGAGFEALLRGAVTSEASARLVREFFATQIQRRLLRGLDTPIPAEEVPLRASLVASQLFGLAWTKYVLKFEPLASTSTDTIVAMVAPIIGRYLTTPQPL
jgi:AcrR family transcriptional regulator